MFGYSTSPPLLRASVLRKDAGIDTRPFASILCHFGGATTRLAIRRPAFLTPENATLITKWKVTGLVLTTRRQKMHGQLNGKTVTLSLDGVV